MTAPAHRLRRGLYPVGRRRLLALGAAMAIGMTAPWWGPLFGVHLIRDGGLELTGYLILVVLVTSVFTLAQALIDHLVLRTMTHRELEVSSRVERVRTGSRLYRWFMQPTATGGSFQLIALAAMMLVLLVNRPEEVSLPMLLVLAVISMISAWLGIVIAFAAEYTAIDGRGTAYEIIGAPTAERRWEEYLHMAILVQTSSAPSDAIPQTREARRVMRSQSVLAYLTNTVVLAVGTSLVFTALGSGGA